MTMAAPSPTCLSLDRRCIEVLARGLCSVRVDMSHQVANVVEPGEVFRGDCDAELVRHQLGERDHLCRGHTGLCEIYSHIKRLIGWTLLNLQVVIFDMSRTIFIDNSAAIAIADLIRIAAVRRQGRVVITGLTRPATETLDAFCLRATMPEGLIVPDMGAARNRARDLLTSG